MKYVLKALTLLLLILLSYFFYWFSVIPQNLHSRFKAQLRGFSVAELGHAAINYEGNYFGEKYKVRILNQEKKPLDPYIDPYYVMHDMVSITKESFGLLAFPFGAREQMNIFSCRAMLRAEWRDLQAQFSNADILRICGQNELEIIFGLNVEEFKHENRPIYCLLTNWKSREAMLKAIREADEEVATGLELYAWVKDRLGRGYPKVMKRING